MSARRVVLWSRLSDPRRTVWATDCALTDTSKTLQSKFPSDGFELFGVYDVDARLNERVAMLRREGRDVQLRYGSLRLYPMQQ